MIATKRMGSERVSGRRLRWQPLALLFFFLILLSVGISLDEPARVLEQARAICLSCIGIG